MAQQSARRHSSSSEAQVDAGTADTDRTAAVVEEADDLLDEIDSVLEENMEEFVKGYVQKGGQ